MGRRGYQAWTQDECELLQALIDDDADLAEVVSYFPTRGERGIYDKIRYLNNAPGARTGPDSLNRNTNLECDTAFQSAMMKAISDGFEMPRIGILKAPPNDDFRPKSYHPEPTHSGCSSAAFECALLGG